MNDDNEKYKIDYYYSTHNYPYTWKLTITGPKLTIYEGEYFNFKLDFNKGINRIAHCVVFEKKNHNLNFFDNNGHLQLKIIYNPNKSFYDNILLLINTIYSLFLQ